MDSLQDLREEYERNGVGVLLYELLAKIVWATVRQYPPSEYSPSGSWDKTACEDVLHDWVTERLWGRADLQAMLSSAGSLAQLRSALTTSLRQHVTNKRRRSIASNLYKRVLALLRNDSSFRSVGGPSLVEGEQRWTLAENESTNPSALALGDLVHIACELTDDELQVVRYGPLSQKLSPILREHKLLEFLRHLMSRAEGSLTVSTIIDVMRFRFALPSAEHTELDENLASSKPSPADEAARTIAARALVSRLDLEDVGRLKAYFTSNGDFSEAAKQCGSTVERVREVAHRAFGAICECSESEDDARSIMNTVESLLIGGDK
jgi:hypothetical protein